MRLAVLSDIHGNSVALDAVLADLAAQGGADRYLVLGDLVAIGPRPREVMERLASLPGLSMIYGNTDGYVLAAADGRVVPGQPSEANQGYVWTAGQLVGTPWLDVLRSLPRDDRRVLPDGTRLLATHAAPGQVEGSGITPHMGAEEIAPLFRGVDCALFLFGHVHYQQDRWVGGVHLVNPGSVSLTNHGDGLARYAILEARASGITVHLRAVAYDVEVVAQDCFAVGHPIAPTIAKRLRRGW